jgi:TolB protein
MTVAILTLLVAVAGVQADTANVASTSIRSPSYAPDGRLAFESNGDLWILPAGWETTGDTMLGDAIRITSGPGWDRHPTWARDGGAIVFSSDRDGPPGLWQIEIGTDGAVAAPRRLTDSGERDTQPTVDPEGAIVFVRGSSAAADLWILPPGGEARRLTDRPGAELDPAVSPDGSEVVYVSVVDGRRQLRRLRRDDPEADSVVLTGSNVALPTWSPSGDLIAYTTLAGRRAVWVTSPTGTFTNLVQEGSAAVAWAPRGDVLVLTAVPRLGPSYN